MDVFVWVQLNEQVIGTDGVWNVGEIRPVHIRTAADWFDRLWAVPARAPRNKSIVAPEKAVIAHYQTPERMGK